MSTRRHRPLIGITVGDPAGIGPEIIVKALQEGHIYETCRPLVLGTRAILERAAVAAGVGNIATNIVQDPDEGLYGLGTIDVLEVGTYDLSTLEWGCEQELAGRISMDAISASIDLGLRGKIDAVTTAPVNKVSIKMVGVTGGGQTEIYQEGTGAPFVLTMFDCVGMRVFHLSRHISLADAIRYATKENIVADVERIHDQLTAIGVRNPLIAVAGLNPHCGEGGLFGDEEIREIIPAIEEARSRGINVTGPVSADTLFARGKTGEFDAILALYHDQGHTPCKTLDLEGTVSVTLGLPFVRCTPDHGTAFDIAGKGLATSRSMRTAIDVTVKYANLIAGAS